MAGISGTKRCPDRTPESSKLYYYSANSRLKKCRNPEVSSHSSESENAEMTEEMLSHGQVRQMHDSIDCDYSSDSSNYQTDPEQSEELLYPIHSVTSCSAAVHESGMSFSDTSAISVMETHINANCIEEPNLSTTSFQPAHEGDCRTSFHVDSSQSTTILSNSCIAVSDIALSVSQPPVQWYVKFPITMINGKKRLFNSNWYKKYPWLEYSIQKDATFVMPVAYFHPLAATKLRKLLPKLASVIGSMQWEAMEC